MKKEKPSFDEMLELLDGLSKFIEVAKEQNVTVGWLKAFMVKQVNFHYRIEE